MRPYCIARKERTLKKERRVGEIGKRMLNERGFLLKPLSSIVEKLLYTYIYKQYVLYIYKKT